MKIDKGGKIVYRNIDAMTDEQIFEAFGVPVSVTRWRRSKGFGGQALSRGGEFVEYEGRMVCFGELAECLGMERRSIQARWRKGVRMPELAAPKAEAAGVGDAIDDDESEAEARERMVRECAAELAALASAHEPGANEVKDFSASSVRAAFSASRLRSGVTGSEISTNFAA